MLDKETLLRSQTRRRNNNESDPQERNPSDKKCQEDAFITALKKSKQALNGRDDCKDFKKCLERGIDLMKKKET